MPVINIEDRTFHFSQSILSFTRSFPWSPEARVIRDQLIRSGLSIGANVVEAQHVASKKQFLQYVHIALRSARETRYWLRLCRSGLSCDLDRMGTLLQESDELSRILAAIILKGRGLRN